MPKGGNGRSSGSSKIRFIMLEADLADGDLSQITQAITNALKPAAAPSRLIAGTSIPSAAAEVVDVEDEADGVVDDEGNGTTPASSGTQRTQRTTPRLYRTPLRLDLDISAFREFAVAKNPPAEATKRHLVATVWFKEAFDTPNVTVDHVYSAYLEAGWSPKMKDFDKPFRMLKKAGLVKRVEPGTYTVTFPGLNEVRDMGKQAAAPDAGT